jgi:hypothetical protein
LVTRYQASVACLCSAVTEAEGLTVGRLDGPPSVPAALDRLVALLVAGATSPPSTVSGQPGSALNNTGMHPNRMRYRNAAPRRRGRKIPNHQLPFGAPMHVDLQKPLPKACVESERPVTPAESFERATAAAAAVGIALDIATELHGGVFWTSRLRTDIRATLPERARGVRIGGKGPSEAQCLASCAMELAERWSLYQFAARGEPQVRCLDLRTGVTRWMTPPRDLWDTKCVSAGVTYEDAILHSLHELVETRIAGSCPWRPYKIVDLAALFPELPAWVSQSLVVVKSSSNERELHHVTALTLPPDGQFDERVADRIIQTDEHLFWVAGQRRRNAHSPSSGGAAGLDPRKIIFRAMNEIFQGAVGPIGSAVRRPLPAGLELASADELVSYETSSITDDVRLILDRLGAETFVGVVDLTHPALAIPVVKVVSDWDPHRSLASRETLAMFFEI